MQDVQETRRDPSPMHFEERCPYCTFVLQVIIGSLKLQISHGKPCETWPKFDTNYEGRCFDPLREHYPSCEMGGVTSLPNNLCSHVY